MSNNVFEETPQQAKSASPGGPVIDKVRKAARQLATEITESGAKLFDFLGQERELKESREKALEFLDSISRNLDTNTE